MILEVDPPDLAQGDGLTKTPSSGMGTPAAFRAVKEPQGQAPGLEARRHDREFSRISIPISFVWRGLMSVKKCFTGTGRYHDDRDSHLVMETRQYLPTTAWPSAAEKKAVDQYPLGYPRLAACINSDVNFVMYRKFGTLRSRVLLHRQDEINKLEKRLNDLDIRDDEEWNARVRSIKYDREQDSQRSDLVDEIDAKLEHYGKCILYISWRVMADTRRRDAVARAKLTGYGTPDRAQPQELVQLDLQPEATSRFREKLHLSEG